MRLDAPFNYEDGKTVKAGIVQSIPGKIHVTHFLIRSRWEGKELESHANISVFVLLVDKPPQENEKFKSNDYAWACWGMVKFI